MFMSRPRRWRIVTAELAKLSVGEREVLHLRVSESMRGVGAYQTEGKPKQPRPWILTSVRVKEIGTVHEIRGGVTAIAREIVSEALCTERH